LNRTKAIGTAVAVLVIAIAGLVVVRSVNKSDGAAAVSERVPPGGVAPAVSDPAMTTESVPESRQEGVVPLPSDAIGRSPPEAPNQAPK
jgi:hypothetical protein